MIKCVQYNGSGANLFGWSLFFSFSIFGSTLLPMPMPIESMHEYNTMILDLLFFADLWIRYVNNDCI